MHTSCVINRRTKIECIPFKPIQRKETEHKSVKKGRKKGWRDVRKEKERGSETENKKLDTRNKHKYIHDNNKNKQIKLLQKGRCSRLVVGITVS